MINKYAISEQHPVGADLQQHQYQIPIPQDYYCRLSIIMFSSAYLLVGPAIRLFSTSIFFSFFSFLSFVFGFHLNSSKAIPSAAETVQTLIYFFSVITFKPSIRVRHSALRMVSITAIKPTCTLYPLDFANTQMPKCRSLRCLLSRSFLRFCQSATMLFT